MKGRKLKGLYLHATYLDTIDKVYLVSGHVTLTDEEMENVESMIGTVRPVLFEDDWQEWLAKIVLISESKQECLQSLR